MVNSRLPSLLRYQSAGFACCLALGPHLACTCTSKYALPPISPLSRSLNLHINWLRCQQERLPFSLGTIRDVGAIHRCHLYPLRPKSCSKIFRYGVTAGAVSGTAVGRSTTTSRALPTKRVSISRWVILVSTITDPILTAVDNERLRVTKHCRCTETTTYQRT